MTGLILTIVAKYIKWQKDWLWITTNSVGQKSILLQYNAFSTFGVSTDANKTTTKGSDSVVVSSPDSQSRGPGFDHRQRSTCPGSPSLLSFWGRQHGANFGWGWRISAFVVCVTLTLILTITTPYLVRWNKRTRMANYYVFQSNMVFNVQCSPANRMLCRHQQPLAISIVAIVAGKVWRRHKSTSCKDVWTRRVSCSALWWHYTQETHGSMLWTTSCFWTSLTPSSFLFECYCSLFCSRNLLICVHT